MCRVPIFEKRCNPKLGCRCVGSLYEIFAWLFPFFNDGTPTHAVTELQGAREAVAVAKRLAWAVKSVQALAGEDRCGTR